MYGSCNLSMQALTAPPLSTAALLANPTQLRTWALVSTAPLTAARTVSHCQLSLFCCRCPLFVAGNQTFYMPYDQKEGFSLLDVSEEVVDVVHWKD